MFRRRRPLLRGAVVAGGAYAVGKHVQQGRDAEPVEEAPQAEVQPEPAGSGAISDADIEELRKLAKLKEDGILTDEEFEAQKAKLLGG